MVAVLIMMSVVAVVGILVFESVVEVLVLAEMTGKAILAGSYIGCGGWSGDAGRCTSSVICSIGNAP